MSRQERGRELCDAGRMLYERGLLAAYEGNLSVRLAGSAATGRSLRILITPAGTCKGLLHPRDLVEIRAETAEESARRPSSELPLHRMVYDLRSEARAVVHVHPPYATAFACTRQGLRPLLQAELIQLLGGPVPLAPFADPGSNDLAGSLRPFVAAGHRAILMANHGLLCWSATSLLDACLVAEQVEQVARSTWLARQLGDLNELDPESLRHLRP